MSCQHLADAADPQPANGYQEGCLDCVAEGHHNWVHLRVCLDCGHVGCCDSSPAKHASAHFRGTEHPVMRSYEPGESWRWCFVDETVG